LGSAVFCDITRRSPLKMAPIRHPETSVNNEHTTPRNIAEDRRSQEAGLVPRSVRTIQPVASRLCYSNAMSDVADSVLLQAAPCLLSEHCACCSWPNGTSGQHIAADNRVHSGLGSHRNCALQSAVIKLCRVM
jgi:hypothetical protein